MKNRKLALEWLRRAKSNLLRAGQERASQEILLEDLVFDCQQCAEKCLKAICIDNDIDFPMTHSIDRLFELLKENNIKLFENVEDALILTDYAVQTRYPGFYNTIEEYEYLEAYKIASTLFDWAEKLISEYSEEKTDKT